MKSKTLALAVMLVLIGSSAVFGGDWRMVTEKARGQTVFFNAWGGAAVINDYIRWAADRMQQDYGITVRHVKVTDIGDVVSRILAEKTAGRQSGGSVDLIWINGENFRAMKDNGLLYGPFTHRLPNYRWVDAENKPTILYDFTTPVDHLEAPWGMAQLVFMADMASVTRHPSNMQQWLDFAREHRGRVTYPAPPDFYGTTFVKQAFLELVDDRAPLYRPVTEADFERVTSPLWAFLDALHPLMWRQGRVFPGSAPEMKQLLNDGEIRIALSFNPNDANNAIVNGELPATVRTFVHQGGTIGNTHFLAIPFNANAKEGAMVLADFLMSPVAQARKADPNVWGDPTVLAVDRLPPADRERFEKLPRGAATLSSVELGPVLLEPDASWVAALENAWRQRYHR